MMSIAVDRARQKLMEAGLAFQGDFKGCTEQEILSLEDHFRVQLPASYRDFLTVMGRYAGAFLVGSDYSYPKMFGFRAGAEALLQIWRPDITLPATAFVFFSHQGYNYEWFNCRHHADDPPVVLFTEELEKKPRTVAESFSAWLLGAVDDDIAAYRGLHGG
jgi:hypothetical protein